MLKLLKDKMRKSSILSVVHPVRMNKNGMNDVSIFLILFLYMLISSVVVTTIQSEFTGETTTYNVDNLNNDTAIQEPQDLGRLDFWSFFIGFFKINFLLGGLDVNIWFGLFNTVISYTWLFLIARNIWVGGGG